VAACRRYERAIRPDETAARLAPHLADPAVRGMLENLTALLNRQPLSTTDGMVPYAKWAEAQREADRLRVEVDLLKMALEDAQNSQPAE